jgi:hypothetical protein
MRDLAGSPKGHQKVAVTGMSWMWPNIWIALYASQDSAFSRWSRRERDGALLTACNSLSRKVNRGPH